MSLSDPLVGGTTLLAASAGTGKTFHIAQTVLRLVAEQAVPIQRIVVVTFTIAAASKLGERVRHRLRDALLALRDARHASDDVMAAWVAANADQAPVLRARLRRALVDFDESVICTIHGFCQRMLGRNAFETGATFGAELVGDVSGLLDDLVSDFWTRTMYAVDPDLLPALSRAGIDHATLYDLARKASDPDLPIVPPHLPASPPDLAGWRRGLTELRDALQPDVLYALLVDNDAVAHRRSSAHPVFFASVGTRKALEAVREYLSEQAPTRPPPDALRTFTPASVAAATRPGCPPPAHPFFGAAGAHLDAHASLRPGLAAHVMSLKHELVAHVRSALPRTVTDANLRTYGDMLRMLRDALFDPNRGPALVAALRSQFDVALIDEFQDTDPVQWAIFEAVFTEHLFLIGDPKQAIYSFRGADVFTYQRAASTADSQHGLSVSHRSDARLVSALNHLYGRVRRPFGADEPRYVPIRAHHPPSRLAGDTRPPLQVRYMPRKGAVLNQNVLARSWVQRVTPALVADDICAELARATQIVEEGGPRRASPGDCAVLVRSNKQADAVREALRARGVPSVSKSDKTVLQSDTAAELLTVLQAVATPTHRSRVNLALTTRLLGRTADDLMTPSPQTLADFRRWKRLWVDTSFAAMFTGLQQDERIRERLLCRDGGGRRLTDLEHLFELLDDAASRLRLSPAGLISWLRRGGPDADPERVILRRASDADAVHVVTMHSAKGLEYPMVWCPYLLQGGFLFAMDKVHLSFHDPDSDHRLTLDIGSPQLEAHVQQREREQLQEDLRLVYVALTRARHRLVLYWGIGGWTSALGYLLHQRADDPVEQLVTRVRGRLRNASSERVLADLKALARHDDISLCTVDWAAGPSAPDWREPVEPGELQARRITRAGAPDRFWRRASYTALTRGVDWRAPRPELDRDEAAEAAPLEEAIDPDAELIRLAEVRGGADFGTALHEVLERVDFQDLANLGELVADRTRTAGLDPESGALVAEALRDAIATPLDATGFRLADLPRGRRLDELEFTFPVRGGFSARGAVTVGALAAAFDCDDAHPDYAERLRGLRFEPLRGFLVGAIDLVFNWEERWYVADYKSNMLGRAIGDYAHAHLAAKMQLSHYTLQYHLYVLALHRLLRTRIPDYSYDTAMGGAYYLFLRGMTPAAGPSRGVFFDRPAAALIGRLDELFDAQPP